MILIPQELAQIIHCEYIVNNTNLIYEEWLINQNIILDYDGMFVENEEHLTFIALSFNRTKEERDKLQWEFIQKKWTLPFEKR